jgi:hypothetical protein
VKRLRQALRIELAALGPAYGFTLTIWTTGAMLMHYHGTPLPWEVVVFGASVLAAMSCVALLAFGAPVRRWSRAEPKRYALGVVHVGSVLLGLGASWGLAALIDGAAAWAVAPFAATAAFEVVVAVEILVSTAERHPPDPAE